MEHFGIKREPSGEKYIHVHDGEGGKKFRSETNFEVSEWGEREREKD